MALVYWAFGEIDMQSQAKTVLEYLSSLPEDRTQQISLVRDVILANLPEGIEENMNWGMITYEVPLSVCPNTYNGQPLMYAALASQKNHMAVYMNSIYANDKLKKDFVEEYNATGKKLDMGKSCVRFKAIDNLPLGVIGKAIAAVRMDEFVSFYQISRGK